MGIFTVVSTWLGMLFCGISFGYGNAQSRSQGFSLGFSVWAENPWERGWATQDRFTPPHPIY